MSTPAEDIELLDDELLDDELTDDELTDNAGPSGEREEHEHWRMVVFTKGELQDQENKLRRSGLLKYFDDVEITSDKTQHEFLLLCKHNDIHPSELLMVGNSLKSDIAPALAIGAWAVYIPFHVTWELEHTDSFEHPRMVQIEHFSQLLTLYQN